MMKELFKQSFVLVLFALLAGSQNLNAQSAAEKRLISEYSGPDYEEMKTIDPVKYKYLLYLYGSGFKMEESGRLRDLSEAEVLSLDLRSYDEQRAEDSRVSVKLNENISLVLLSRNEFISGFEAILSPEEKQAMKEQMKRGQDIAKSDGSESTD